MSEDVLFQIRADVDRLSAAARWPEKRIGEDFDFDRIFIPADAWTAFVMKWGTTVWEECAGRAWTPRGQAR